MLDYVLKAKFMFEYPMFNLTFQNISDPRRIIEKSGPPNRERSMPCLEQPVPAEIHRGPVWPLGHQHQIHGDHEPRRQASVLAALGRAGARIPPD